MTKGDERLYFNLGVVALEKLYADGQNNAAVLKLLRTELNHRETDRAGRLLEKVNAALKQSGGDGAAAAEMLVAAPASVAATTVVVEPAFKSVIEPTAPAPDAPASTAPLRGGIASELLRTPAPLDHGDIGTPFARPSRKNEPAAILASWVATEALSPQTYQKPEDLISGDKWCVADLGKGLPWTLGEKAKPKTRLFYQVLLGAIDMGGATQMLIDSFGQDEERSRPERKKAAIASILVDKNGIPVDDGVAVSSFAWAFPKTLQGNLGALGNWPLIERRVITRLEEMFRRVDEQGRPLPITRQQIDAAHQWLVSSFSMPGHLVELPRFALRVYHWFRAPGLPDALLLNSFFINDLVRAGKLVAGKSVPAALARYLGEIVPTETFDLQEDTSALEAVVAPRKMPLAQWPARGGHPLVLLQQAAVNVSQMELVGKTGMVAVNGPPGTGKTTLLRDVISARILDRASAMVEFEKPEDAFIPSGQKVKAGEAAFFQIYKLDERLKGHEIVVASSNNKAVENVSKELPGISAIGRDPTVLNYFKSISDLLFRSVQPDEELGVQAAPESVETWGLAAAVLGNGRNRAAFQQRFWWDEELGFRLYLKAAKGDSLVREIKDEETGRVIERRIPRIMDAERPPTPEAARRNWKTVRSRFLTLRSAVQANLADLETLRQVCLRIPTYRQDATVAGEAYAEARRRLNALEAALRSTDDQHVEARLAHNHHKIDLDAHALTKPGFWSRLFQTARWRAWVSQNTRLARSEIDARTVLHAAEKALMIARQAVEAFVPVNAAKKTEADSRATILSDAQEQIARHQRANGNNALDETFFSKPHATVQLTAPWLPKALRQKREDLFVAALAVQRAFVDASAQKVLHNLSVFFMDQSAIAADPDRRNFLSDLWSTFFMVIPVISTTFASVDRMLSGLDAEALGWLLIDEAGQATPQAAVGAIMRTKRVMVVGDPLQIPPVVSLPERLSSEICAYFAVSKTVWAAPDASAQTLADKASRFISSFSTDIGKRHVGVPLLVHRRCQEPMFGISNAIAYDSQMVFAAGAAKPGHIADTLGASHWLDIDGHADSKWCPAEGEGLIRYLNALASAGIKNPDLFVISPFRIVAEETRRRIEREPGLLRAFGVNSYEWLRDRVGTIHTFQGREADSVFLVLGAPNAAQNGARIWAASTPNILNVAVSRAKENLYVVGSRASWSGVGHARELAQVLTTRPAKTLDTDAQTRSDA